MYIAMVKSLKNAGDCVQTITEALASVDAQMRDKFEDLQSEARAGFSLDEYKQGVASAAAGLGYDIAKWAACAYQLGRYFEDLQELADQARINLTNKDDK